jgi:hypothetical protein
MALRWVIGAAGVFFVSFVAFSTHGDAGLPGTLTAGAILIVVWAPAFGIFVRSVRTRTGSLLIGGLMLAAAVWAYVAFLGSRLESSTAGLAIGDGIILDYALVLIWRPIERRLASRAHRFSQSPPAAEGPNSVHEHQQRPGVALRSLLKRRDWRQGLIDLIESRIAESRFDVEIVVPRPNISWTWTPSLSEKAAFLTEAMGKRGYSLVETRPGLFPWSLPRLLFRPT